MFVSVNVAGVLKYSCKMQWYIFLLCFIAVPSTFGDTSDAQNGVEPDRARSAWNFGGGASYPIKRAVYWNRPKIVAGPGSILTNRRMESGMEPLAPIRIKSKTPSMPQIRRQSYSYTKPAQQARPVVKRHAKFYVPPSPAFPQNYPMSYNSNQQKSPFSTWHRRSSRKLRTNVDNIKNRFMKEDLWHLDKGESYAVRDEDLVRDNLLRNRNYETNAIDNEENAYLHQLEKDAEKMINQGETAVNSMHDAEKEKTSQHIHHHHHYEQESNASHSKKELHKKPFEGKKPVPAPLPRIHNPIPLGCLLAVPVFHPIRPRHHLACLLSLPGTPNLIRRRRRRSVDLPEVILPTQGQSQSMFQQLFGSNSRMTPVVTRKHYSSHVGNGKNPNPSSPAAQQNFKVPATIIAPPKFSQDDVLSMLLGSGGVQADKMGTIVATNNRYVRYGRGLPNGRDDGRQGRNLQWMTGKNNIAQPTVKGQSPIASSTHHASSMAKLPPPQKAVKKPVAHLTPPPSSPYVARKPYPQPPVILNVQISPMSSPRVPSGPVITVPVQQHSNVHEQQQQPPQQQQSPPPHNIEQILQSNTLEPLQQQPSNIEQQEKEKQITEEQHQQQHWIIEHLHQRLQQLNMEQFLQKYQQQHQSGNEQQQQEQSTTERTQERQIEQQQVEQHQTLPTVAPNVSPSGEVQTNENLKYIILLPQHQLTKSKSKKAHSHDFTNMNIEPSESKQVYRKVKVDPVVFMQEKVVDNPSSFYESNTDQVFDSGISNTDSGSDYYQNSFNVDLGSVESSGIDSGNYVSDPAIDMYNDFFEKKNYKDELDSVLHDISTKERGIYSSAQSVEDYDRNTYDDINRFVSGGSNNDYSGYSQVKYYTAKRVPEQLPDPIYINVPKENRYSNELYDSKK